MKPIFPSIGYDRLRMETDGEGVTTLVCAQGCPLRCRYCINPESSCQREKPRHIFTPESLYELLKIDSLYFLATGGGVMFGGGEPLLYVDFMEAFSKLAPDWKIYCETSLWVNPRVVERAAQFVDHFMVDIKDTDPEIYRAYTGKEFHRAGVNLRTLLSLVGAEKITVRLPLIPEFNTNAHRDRSEALLREWGVTRFDRFDYIIKEKK
ncbi:MAG: radical SAM protein [Clostridia bacterium]|nr:radical SAM protein [Clostridia bacterium]